MIVEITRVVKYCNLIIENQGQNIDLCSFYLIQIGENLNRINSQLSDSSIPVRQIVGLRNILVHEYHKADLDIVKNICLQEIPVLKQQCLELVKIG